MDEIKRQMKDKTILWKVRSKLRSGRKPAKPQIKECGPMWRAGLKGGIDWYRYVYEVVEPVLLPGLQRFQGMHFPRGVFLQQDGAAPHRAKWTQEYLEQHHVRQLAWPGNSPDLNPIEHIWDLMKRRIAAKYRVLKPGEAVKEAWLAEWSALTVNDVNPWIEHQKVAIERVKAHRGGNHFHG